MKIDTLRKKYPCFVYKEFDYYLDKRNLRIFFDFFIPPDISFRPEIIIENVNKNRLVKIGDRVLKNLIFNLGMAEMISYWKSTASQKIVVEANGLNKDQLVWWKNLIMNGMGQFFYENKINFRKKNFLEILSKEKQYISLGNVSGQNILIPVSGGKDSIVALEVLGKNRDKINCFSLNPNGAAKKIIRLSGCKKPVVARRKIDRRLIELNRRGYLNSHTPFSAYLAFLSVLCAEIFNYKYIAFANERSSNEGNVKYLGKEVNHQYSKSFAFEKRFRIYTKKYLSGNIEYFSFLRPSYEIQIANLFSEYPKYFKVFSSCNQGGKILSQSKKLWCGKCPKCLFVFAVLAPFIPEKELLMIFGKNLFQDSNLISLMKSLIGENRFKPFECVGTRKESLVAFYLGLKKYQNRKFSLLEYFSKNILPKHKNLEKDSQNIMRDWNKENFLPKNLSVLLENAFTRVSN